MASRYLQRYIWREYLKRQRQPHKMYLQNVKSKQHGNFHFHDDGLITLQKQGNLLLSLRRLERLYYLLTIQSWEEGRSRDYCWRKFNRGIQKMIDSKLAELEPLVEQLRLE